MRSLEDYPDAHLRIFERPKPPKAAEINDVYLIGICGTGMGSLAALFNDAGFAVRGSDHAAWPPMSDRLAALGIPVIEGFSADNLLPPPSLVVVGNACTPTHPEAAAARERSLAQVSFPEALAHYFIGNRRSIVVTGTHGKTSTTGLLVHVFETAGLVPGYLVGGVRVGSEQSQAIGTGTHFITEGDEYDSAYFDKRPKFFHYRPDVAIVTSVEFDHADIYDGDADYREAFAEFASILDPEGLLVLWGDDPVVANLATSARCHTITYGLTDACDYHVADVVASEAGTSFTLHFDGHNLGRLMLAGWGRHNLLNAVAGTVVALNEGVDLETVNRGLSSFAGMKRRQEIRGVVNDITVVDDFAHHPTAVRETILAIRERWPNKRLIAVFEPRSNSSRLRLFEDVYPGSFGPADAVFLARPPVRHNDRPDDFMDIDVVADSIASKGMPVFVLDSPAELLAPLHAFIEPGDVVLIMSNGAIGGLHGKLLSQLESSTEANP
ncbi:MAG: UDP-N-acetylmuramate--L-alanine ligase, partial [Rhodothermia bacterium]